MLRLMKSRRGCWGCVERERDDRCPSNRSASTSYLGYLLILYVGGGRNLSSNPNLCARAKDLKILAIQILRC